MAYFFRRIDANSSSVKSERREVIYNLDEFHTITRHGKRITASRSDGKSILIANCQSDAGAEYIMECIYSRKLVDIHQLTQKEIGSHF